MKYEMPEAQRPDAFEKLAKAFQELRSLAPARDDFNRTDWPSSLTQAQKDCLHMTLYHLEQAMKAGRS